MIDVVFVGISFSKSIFYLSPNSLELNKGDKVVIDTENGECIGTVLKGVYKENSSNLELPLNNVLRIADKKDLNAFNKNLKDADGALIQAKKYVIDLQLDMNLVDCMFNLDRSQLIFTFLSDNRVDFRDLAKKLASKFKTRIELRQIGVRDKAKKIGGLGPCGLFLCCNSFLTDFNGVSINMAKNQMLALNPSKINGICGRLFCCLGYENDVYTELKKDLPKVGLVTDTPLGMGKVVSLDVLKGTYSVDLKENGVVEFSKDDKK